jgi:hypothetical protein
MVKYEIEGGIDFYEELYKSLDEETTENQECCLISNLPLEEDFVKLECSHKFNYGPLFKEICKQKRSVNDENYNVIKMLIKCPYCRCLQSKLLPPKEGFRLIYGVNTNTNVNHSNNEYIPNGYIEGKCDYTFPHLTNPGHIVICETPYVSKIDNGKCYCYYHKYLGIKIMWDEIKQKAKEEKIAAKLKAKQVKAEAKLKEKQEKIEAKKKAQEDANVEQKNCVEILKSGKRKGLPCDCKVFEKNDYCLRHYNLSLKNNT